MTSFVSLPPPSRPTYNDEIFRNTAYFDFFVFVLFPQASKELPVTIACSSIFSEVGEEGVWVGCLIFSIVIL